MGFPDLDIESIFLILLFIVPGFISVQIKNSLVSKRESSESKFLVEIVIFTFLNYTILTQLISYSENFFELKVKVFELRFLAKFWAVSILTGLITGFIIKEDLYYKVLRKLRITKMAGVPTPWDKIFSKNSWVIITLLSGEIYEGYVRYVSTYPAQKEIYIEKVRLLDNDKKTIKELESDGIWINYTNIKNIEVSY